MILSYLIFGLSIISFILGVNYLKMDISNKKNWYYLFTSIGSTIWGLGFGFLLIQTNEIYALYCRAFGMIGVFLFAIFGIKIMTTIANTPDKLKNVITIITYFGIILYPFVIMPGRLDYHMGNFGMSYTFVNDFWNTLYNLYSLVILVLFIVVLIKMRKDCKFKREKLLNNRLWLFFICFCGGTVLDTILPMLGIYAFPGSTLSQFFAIYIVYYSLVYENDNSLSFNNIFRHIHHSIEMPIIIFDDNRKLFFVSDSFYNFFELKKGEESNLKITDLFVLESEESAFKFFDRSLIKECFAKHVHRYCSLTIEKVYDSYNDVVGYIVLVNDLTDKHKMITELKEAKEIAEDASKSKDNFLANMSHEIRTPLNAIIGVNDLIAKESTIGKIKNYSEQVNMASKNLLSIVDDLFDFSNIQTGNLKIVNEEYDFLNIIKELACSYKTRVNNKDLSYSVFIDKNVPKLLYGDSDRIRQCVDILLKNAFKYTNSGNVSVNVYADNLVNNIIDITIEVTDTGIGIKKEDVESIFESFSGLEESNNRLFEGTGLGLTIVKSLMTLMNGNLEIQSEYGVGSNFILKFQQKVVIAELSDGFELSVGSDINFDNRKNSKIKIAPKAKLLAVDDNKINLMVLKEFLKRSEAEVDTCFSGSEAILKCKENHYDVIFLDHMMPGMDGIETLNRIRTLDGNTDNNVPIVVVTANAAPGAEEYYLGNGFDDYISKPVDLDLLNEILFKYLPEDKIEEKEID